MGTGLALNSEPAPIKQQLSEFNCLENDDKEQDLPSKVVISKGD